MKTPHRRRLKTVLLTVLTVLLVWLDFFTEPPMPHTPVQTEVQPSEEPVAPETPVAAPAQFHPVRLMEEFVQALAFNGDVNRGEAN